MIINCLHGYGKPAVADISPENKLFHNPNLTDYAYDLERGAAAPRRGRLRRSRRRRRHRGRSRQPDRVLPPHQRRQPGAREDVLDPQGGLEQARHEGATTGRSTSTLLVEKLDVTFDWDAILIGFTGSVEPQQRRQPAALERQPAPVEPEPDQSRRRSWEAEIDRLLDEGSRELERREAAAVLLAHPGDPARGAAHDPDRAAHAVPRLQALAAELLPDRLGHLSPRAPALRALTRRVAGFLLRRLLQMIPLLLGITLPVVPGHRSGAGRLLQPAAHEPVDLAGDDRRAWSASSATAIRCWCATRNGCGAAASRPRHVARLPRRRHRRSSACAAVNTVILAVASIVFTWTLAIPIGSHRRAAAALAARSGALLRRLLRHVDAELLPRLPAHVPGAANRMVSDRRHHVGRLRARSVPVGQDRRSRCTISSCR